jgi:hypothetical protein
MKGFPYIAPVLIAMIMVDASGGSIISGIRKNVFVEQNSLRKIQKYSSVPIPVIEGTDKKDCGVNPLVP